ncbi:MAG: TrbG/VirB9 family P-type conjugative transfer protein [Burkholderiaceae bacterium]
MEISPQEQVKDFGTGFSDGWELVRRDNIFYLRPKNVDVDTNMYIRTNMRSYLLDLKVSATKWRTLKMRSVPACFTGSIHLWHRRPRQGKPAGCDQRGAVAYTQRSLNSQGNYHLNYDYSTVRDDSTIVPTRVYDNQQFLYIHLPPMANFPAVFARHERNGESFW